MQCTKEMDRLLLARKNKTDDDGDILPNMGLIEFDLLFSLSEKMISCVLNGTKTAYYED